MTISTVVGGMLRCHESQGCGKSGQRESVQDSSNEDKRETAPLSSPCNERCDRKQPTLKRAAG